MRGQIIIWVIVGGLGTLIGPVIGSILVQMLTTYAGTLPRRSTPTWCWGCCSCSRS